MENTDIYSTSLKRASQQVLLSLMLSQRQDYWSRRTITDITFRVFMFLLTIVALFAPLADKPLSRQATLDYVLAAFTCLIIVLLWNSARTSLDRSIRMIEIELFRLVEGTGQAEDNYIRSKSMSYPGLINRHQLFSTFEPGLWLSVIINAFLLRHVKGI